MLLLAWFHDANITYCSQLSHDFFCSTFQNTSFIFTWSIQFVHMNYIYSLSNSMQQSCCWEADSYSLIKKYPASSGTWRFIIVCSQEITIGVHFVHYRCEVLERQCHVGLNGRQSVNICRVCLLYVLVIVSITTSSWHIFWELLKLLRVAGCWLQFTAIAWSC